MKKLFILSLILLATAAMSDVFGQYTSTEVFSSGIYTTASGNVSARIFKGSNLMYSTPMDDLLYDHYANALAVDPATKDVYWVDNAVLRSNNNIYYSTVRKNGMPYLNNPETLITYIYDLYWCPGVALYAAGTIQGPNTLRDYACVWLGTVQYCKPNYDNGYPSAAYGVKPIGVNSGIQVFYCGYEAQTEGGYQPRATVWKGNSVLYTLSSVDSYAYDLDIYNDVVYTVGVEVVGGNNVVKVWQNNTEMFTLTQNNYDPRSYKIIVDGGDVYVSGYGQNHQAVIWKNGQVLYTTPTGEYCGMVATTSGLYHTYTSTGGVCGIMQNGNQIHALGLNECDRLYDLDVYIKHNMGKYQPVCVQTFSEHFENLDTWWDYWTVYDEHANGNATASNIVDSYWHRVGKGVNNIWPAEGDHCAYHGENENNPQAGHLISPPIFLKPYQDNISLIFKSREQYWNSNTTAEVKISIASMTPTDFTTLYTITSPSDQWKPIAIDLTAYSGEYIYLDFYYSGQDGGRWAIDDVTIEQTWNPCLPAVSTFPYVDNFDNGLDDCWYVADYDMFPGKCQWKYYPEYHCVCHPCQYGSGRQEGALVSKSINLQAGHDYVLKFSTQTLGSGSEMYNSVRISTDGNPNPEDNHYTQIIWSDTEYSHIEKEITIPLTAYAGNTVSIMFYYVGNSAHTWKIDNFRVEEAVAQYNITAQSANAAWGSVSGSGTYNINTSCTLTATPASGYYFKCWRKNGIIVSSDASYTFNVQGDGTYVAYFGEQPTNYYEISTDSGKGNGTTTGDGIYQENSSVTLGATADPGYRFDHWNGGNSMNPRVVTVTGNAAYSAYFVLEDYTVSTGASPSNGGSSYGGGTYHYGDETTLQAVPASGYYFAGWSDGNNENPRTVSVTGNANYVAVFAEESHTYYNVSVDVTPSGSGVVTGTGAYEVGQTAVLNVVANTGYHFTQWSDGNMQNPRSVLVDGNKEYEAIIDPVPTSVMVFAEPAHGGSVTGSGNYHYGDNVVLTAYPNENFDFIGWSDGSSENPHTFVCTDNVTITAYFNDTTFGNYYLVTGITEPAEAGIVYGSGTYDEGATITLQTEAFPGYTFTGWHDGSMENPRTVTVNNNMSFVAYYEADTYDVMLTASPEEGGTVSGGGQFHYNEVTLIEATPNEGYNFITWSDGDYANPRYIVVEGDVNLEAIFADDYVEMRTLEVSANDPSLGTVTGGGSYPLYSIVEINAYPNENARFVQWSDGDISPSKPVYIENDITLVAEFEVIPQYTVEVYSANLEGGVALGGGTYLEGTFIGIIAFANPGYSFSHWSDGSTEYYRTFEVYENATYIAYFDYDDVEEVTETSFNVYPNPANDKVHINGLRGGAEIRIFNIMGEEVMRKVVYDDNEIDVSRLSSGIYLMQFGNTSIRFVKTN